MSPRVGTHRCVRPGCERYVGKTRLMCYPDWSAIPQAIRDEILRTWDPRGGIRQSPEYFAAVNAALAALGPQQPATDVERP